MLNKSSDGAVAMLKSVRYQVGHWTFIPSAHELRSGTARVRLQQRASATLSLLCERPGEVVSRQDIVARAWGRQHLSPNSVAIVIGDLRRALGIGAGEPGSIETLPKAGYRLTATVEPLAPRRATPLRAIVVAGIAIAAAAGLSLALLRPSPARPEVVVGSIDNAMGTNRYAPLIRACSATVLVALGRHSSDVSVVEAPPGRGDRPDYVLQQRWVLWSGDPELVLVARDAAGQTVWSGAVYGPENSFPAKIAAKVAQFTELAKTRRGGG